MRASSAIAIRALTLLRSTKLPANRSGYFILAAINWPIISRVSAYIVEPLTEIGKVTVRLLRLNSAERVAERVLL